MALIIVMAGSNSAFDKYDIVDVLDDTADSGKQVLLPTFFIFKIAGSKSELSFLKDGIYEDVSHPVIEMGTIKKLVKLRKHYFNFDETLTLGQIESVSNSEEMLYIEIDESDIGVK